MARKLEVEIIGDSRSLERAFGRAADSGSRFGNGLKRVGKYAAFAAGGAALGGLYAVVRSGISEIRENQKVTAQTAAVLKSTGKAANVTAKDVEDLGSEIQSYSGISDEAIRSTQNLLLTFTNIRNQAGKNNDIFTQATKIATDMSVALGQDMKSSAIQLGKALNDPIKGVTALQRVGVSFTQQQRDQIKALVDSGKSMQAQKLILAELNREFAGSAKAYGDTLPGQISKAKEAFGDLSGILLSALVPAFTAIVEKANELLGWVSDHMPEIKATFEAVFTPIGEIVQRAFGVVSAAISSLKPDIASFGASGKSMFQTFRRAAEAAAPIIKTMLEIIQRVITNVVIPILQRLGEVGRVIMAALAKVFQEHGPEIQRILQRLGALVETVGKVMLWLADKIVIPILKPLFGKVLPEVLGVTIVVIDKVSAAIETLTRLMKTLYTFGSQTFKKIAKVVAPPLEVIRDVVMAVANAVSWLLDRINAVLDKAGELLDIVGKVGSAIGKIGGAVGKVGGLFRAAGGPVAAGQAYVVGEKGPELFVPGRSGNIIPNAGAPAMATSAGATINVYFPNYVGTRQELIDTVRQGLFDVGRRNPGAIPGLA